MLRPAPRAALIGRVRPSHWRALDRVAAGAYALMAALLLTKHTQAPVPILAGLAGAVLVAAPIAVRRQHPLGSAAVLVTALAIAGPASRNLAFAALIPLTYVLYSVASDSRPRTAAIMLVLAVAAGWTTVLPGSHGRGAAVLFSVLYLIVWAVGLMVGMHRRYTAHLLRAQARLAQAQLQDTRRGITEQRMLIARELHDAVAHTMSVITVQAAFGALVVQDDPLKARAALEAIESVGRQTLTEMRRLLDVLRIEDPEAEPESAWLTPAPGLADFDRLIEQTALAGVRVDLTITGAPRALPSGVDLSAYRIVQEALTNVVKHAATADARLQITFCDDSVVVEICDAGPARPVSATAAPGRGLIGMSERVHLYGGDLQTGPTPEGGFRVRARLPLAEQLAPESAAETQPVP